MLVYTLGTFDLLHVGHLALLEQCSDLGDVLAVGVASDKVVNSYKPNVPVIPLDQRLEMLQALGCVDIVRPYYELEYVSACEALNVDIFVVGEDWGSKTHNTDVERYLEARGKKVVRLVYNSRNSSTSIKNDVLAQNPDHTLATLRRPFVSAGFRDESSNETRLNQPASLKVTLPRSLHD